MESYAPCFSPPATTRSKRNLQLPPLTCAISIRLKHLCDSHPWLHSQADGYRTWLVSVEREALPLTPVARWPFDFWQDESICCLLPHAVRIGREERHELLKPSQPPIRKDGTDYGTSAIRRQNPYFPFVSVDSKHRFAGLVAKVAKQHRLAKAVASPSRVILPCRTYEPPASVAGLARDRKKSRSCHRSEVVGCILGERCILLSPRHIYRTLQQTERVTSI